MKKDSKISISFASQMAALSDLFWSSATFKAKAIFQGLRRINFETLLKIFPPYSTGKMFETNRQALDAHKLYVKYLEINAHASHIMTIDSFIMYYEVLVLWDWILT